MPSVSSAPSSPCIKLCVIEPASGWCLGCGRTIDEIIAWGSLGESDRLALMAGLPERLAALVEPRDTL